MSAFDQEGSKNFAEKLRQPLLAINFHRFL